MLSLAVTHQDSLDADVSIASTATFKRDVQMRKLDRLRH